ncbi:hypothetical protein V1264_016955 [Littorina saxatilis]|uniref:Uncharacterized protein n=1 Tax=Littorina saxatilis TaxID=31220 RepID=A0AAN9BLP0_9CAEN
MKLEKLTIQRNTIITDFGAKISHTRVLSQTTELEVTSRTPSKQVSSTVTSETEDSSQLRSQSPSHSQPESPPVFPQIPEIKVEPLDDDDDNAAFENESSDTTEETAAKHATILHGSAKVQDEKSNEGSSLTRANTSRRKGKAASSLITRERRNRTVTAKRANSRKDEFTSDAESITVSFQSDQSAVEQKDTPHFVPAAPNG